MTRILVVDDERELRQLLDTSLSGYGYSVETANDGVEAVEKVASWQPNVVILDLELPKLDGLHVCRLIRAWSRVPIIVLSVRDSEQDKVAAFELGADDYLTKPFGLRELLARIKVALRHAVEQSETVAPVLVFDGLRLDLARRQVLLRDQEIRLTRKEYDLLTLLARRAGSVLTYAQLLHEVWSDGPEQDIRTLRVLMGQVRRKIADDPTNPRFIFIESGVGYRFRPRHEESSYTLADEHR